ncbi:MAG: helix-turn-helix domain-containing protein, partial [Chloroflexota bacterium]
MDGTRSFADQLRRFRQASSLSQRELAEQAGLSERAVSDLERGVKQRPHPATVRMLADGLALNDADRALLMAAARPETLAPGSQTPP